MKRSRIIVLLRLVVAVLVLAAPAVVHPQAASAGWTWDENLATFTDDGGVADGWTWDEATAPAVDTAATQPADETAATQPAP